MGAAADRDVCAAPRATLANTRNGAVAVGDEPSGCATTARSVVQPSPIAATGWGAVAISLYACSLSLRDGLLNYSGVVVLSLRLLSRIKNPSLP